MEHITTKKVNTDIVYSVPSIDTVFTISYEQIHLLLSLSPEEKAQFQRGFTMLVNSFRPIGKRPTNPIEIWELWELLQRIHKHKEALYAMIEDYETRIADV